MISDLTTFAPVSASVLCARDARPTYEADYREGFGNDFGSELHRTNAVAVLMRVNLLKRMESSVSAFRSTLGRVHGSCADILDRLAALDAARYQRCSRLRDAGYGTEGSMTDSMTAMPKYSRLGPRFASTCATWIARLCPRTCHATSRSSTGSFVCR